MAEEDKYLNAFRTTLPVLIDREMYKVRKQQRSLVLLVCALLGVNMLLFGAGLFLLLYNRQQPVMVQPVVVPSAVAAEPEPEPEAQPVEQPDIRVVTPSRRRTPAYSEPPLSEQATMRDVVPEYILTRSGMTLQELAVRYYGHSAFWVCIYDYNSRVLKDPDMLPLGIRLHLPRPEEYGIDASDPSSLRRARSLAQSLTGYSE